jgi:hypothetical protein
MLDGNSDIHSLKGEDSMKIRHATALFITAAALALSGVISAQDNPMQQQQPPKTDVSKQELSQFAEAQGQISVIQQDFSSQLQGVEDPEKAQELRVQANEEMTAAVEDAGLDVQSFNNIAMAIQNDPELQQRLTAMMQSDSR